MLCALIEKYGVVPQSAMPESYNSSQSREINAVLNNQLRHDAVIYGNWSNKTTPPPGSTKSAGRCSTTSTGCCHMPLANQ